MVANGPDHLLKRLIIVHVNLIPLTHTRALLQRGFLEMKLPLNTCPSLDWVGWLVSRLVRAYSYNSNAPIEELVFR